MLFDKFSNRTLQLANRMRMAPMTRSRATAAHMPDTLMAMYNGQRGDSRSDHQRGHFAQPQRLGLSTYSRAL